MFEKPPITVLGVGNILLSDEGLGVHIIQELLDEYMFSDNVQLIDGGTMGMELLHYIGDVEQLLLVDAISGGEAPGTIYEFRHKELENYFTDHISVHEVGIQDILRIRHMQDKPFLDAVVMGMEPESLEVGMDVTPTLRVNMETLKDKIIAQLKLWGVEVKKHA